MSSKLSTDILSIIFENLEQENDKTLYSCISVNREWCQVAIPFLWKNPWNKFDKHDENEDYEDFNDRYEDYGDYYNYRYDVNEYVDYYENDNWDENDDDDNDDDDDNNEHDENDNDEGDNYDDNQQVNRYKILFKCFLNIIPKESKEFLKMNGINLLIEDTSQNNSTSLQTPLFNYASFCKVIDSFKIHDMISHNFGNSITDYHQYLVGREILKLLISNTSKLKILILHHKSHPMASFPNSSLSLSQLNEFHCDTLIDVTIFYELSQICRNIERLVIKEYINDDNHGLIFFVNQQINLKRVKIWKDYDYRHIAQGQCKNLGEALATKTSSIIEIDLGGCSFTMIGDIIKKTNGKLKKIIIDGYDYYYEDSYTLISTIAKHCPKLEYLAIWVDNDLDGILELTKECKNLRGLVLRSLFNYQIIGKLFAMLYNSASNQLRKLQLDRWELYKEVLNEFFENWGQQQRNSLDFYVSSCILDYDYYDIIKKYQELGVIRKFEEFIRFRDFLESVCSLD